MPQTDPHPPIIENEAADAAVYDAVIVGASLAGCATAIQLGRAGARVALVEKQPDPKAFKRMCSHYIQASGVPTIERLGLLEPMIEAGALRSRVHAWTKWGWIAAPADRAGQGINLRRELLDPLVRTIAAETPGVELMLGWSAEEVRREEGAFAGIVARDREGTRRELRGRLTIGADGRDSRIAELSEVPVKTYPHARFAYGGYFEGPAPKYSPDSSIWFLDPQWAAAFPTDGDLTFYAAMPTKDRLAEFKADPEAALVRFLSDVPDAPPIRESRAIESVIGKIDMTNRMRQVTAPGLALIGDAALATDPLFGVGCGWAFQSAEWLSESIAPALDGAEPLEKGLDRYRRRHGKELRAHAFFIHDYANGRRFNPAERLTFSAAARDPKVATLFDAFGTRQIRPQQAFPRILPRAVAVNARHALAR
ncbi:MAG TPA: NAD(P)/FAD-dependent oxidoreductase [Solirubrobacterales bacterium]|jgi:2-polyprenyl-6-methoxyphenol hydroxylase-like FAD-dependent oxidoreductase|nr:NAD(P)/FAD-dependent oxidoreductase [Solirubrobacterales bacterium]